jgi:short-subunit dehydrogenase
LRDDVHNAGIDGRHLLLVGAGPGLGSAIARRFAEGGFKVTLVARSSDFLGAFADELAGIGANADTLVGDAGVPEDLRNKMSNLYASPGAPGVVIYNAVAGAPDRLLNSSVEHLLIAYTVDVIGAIVVAQVVSAAMQAAGAGTILFTGGGFADHPVPALATVSLGKAALRSAATILMTDLEPDGVRVASLTIAGQIVPDTAFDPEHIAEQYWEIVHSEEWQAEFRFTGRELVTDSARLRRP